MFRNLPPLCKSIIIALAGSAALSLVVPAIIISVMPLYSQLVVHQYQAWRLVTYPFFMLASLRGLIGVIFSLLWKAVIIAMFGGELETIIHTKRLTIMLAITVIAGGLIFSLLSPDGALAGPSMITMFMLGGFAYMWPKREISIFGLFWVKAWMIALAVFVLSVIPMSGTRLDSSAANLFGPIFGSFGAIICFHVMYRQYSFGRAFLNRAEDVLMRRPVRRSVSVRGVVLNDPKAIEARIDAILDKIASNGMQSLSKEEREFLLKHSGRS
jgi:membrane associated rhomboid family serine protease